ncbi:MAG: hypothetical protein WC455_23645 [Dehalococcoidia bacterium]
MKLSTMKTREAAHAIASLAAPISAITKSPAVATLLGLGVSKKLNDLNLETAIPMFLDIVPVLLADNYDDTIKIISVLTGKETAEIDEQTMDITLADIKGIFDSDLMQLFTKSTSSARGKSSKR